MPLRNLLFPSPEGDVEIMAHRIHRAVVGVIGMFLPAILILFGGGCSDLQPSISDYYHHTELTRDIFVGCMFAIGLFLFADIRPDRPQHWLFGPPAGILAVLVAVIPLPLPAADTPIASAATETGIAITAHHLCALALFVVLALKCAFTFPDVPPKWTSILLPWRWLAQLALWLTSTDPVRARDGFYAVSAIAMIAVPALIMMSKTFSGWQEILWAEWIALLCFGTAWAVKGRTVSTIRAMWQALWRNQP